MTTAVIGQPVSRVDGRQKVTGGATTLRNLTCRAWRTVSS